MPAYSFWADYFRGAFAEAGHTCIEAPECDWARGLLPLSTDDAAAWRERTWSAAFAFLRREHAREPIDFFLGYLFPAQVVSEIVREISALGIPTANFFCDNVREFRHVPAAYRAFDLHWVPEFKALALYREAGLQHLHAPMACWVPPAQRVLVPRETLPVTFLGTRDKLRERLFAEAIRGGLAVDLRGPGWDSTASIPAQPPPRSRNLFEIVQRQFDFARQHGWTALARKLTSGLRPAPPTNFDFTPFAKPAQFGEAYWPALRECAVTIGVNRYPSFRFPSDRPDTYSRLRDIEAPMAGACYLTEWTEGLDALYAFGEEIETYRDAAELVEKVRALSGDAPRRARLRAAGQRRALNDHSIAQTIRRIAERLNLSR